MEGRRILVGVIGAAHGVRGDLRLKSYTAEPAGIAGYGRLTSEDGLRRFAITSVRPLRDDMLVVHFDGVDDRSAAERLTNLRLFVDRADLPGTEEDEFYHADLIGLRAETDTGRVLGAVVSLQNFGAGDLIEIAPPRGDTLLVPFSKIFVPVVDIAAGRVVVAESALGDEALASVDHNA